MAYQNLFEAILNVTGFTPLESDMFEIIDAYEKDKAEQSKIYSSPVLSDSLPQLCDCDIKHDTCDCIEMNECSNCRKRVGTKFRLQKFKILTYE